MGLKHIILPAVLAILTLGLCFCHSVGSNNGSGEKLEISSVGIVRTEPHSAEISWQTNIESACVLHYGTTPDCDKEAVPISTDNLIFNIELTELETNTKYYYMITGYAVKDDSLTAESDPRNFTTPLYLGDVIISNILIADVTPHDATITFSTNINSACTLNYGKDANYVETPVDVDTVDGTSHTVTLNQLDYLTAYHFRIWAQSNVSGWTSVYSGDETFDTVDLYEVQITGVEAVPMDSGNYVRMTWITNVKTKTKLYYGKSISYDHILNINDSVYDHSFIYILCDPNETYHYQIEAIPYDFNNPDIEYYYKTTFSIDYQFINDDQ